MDLMDKHGHDYRVDEMYWYETVDRIVLWDPSVQRFVRTFIDKADEVI